MNNNDRIDAFIDVIILAVYIFTISILVVDPIIRYILIIAGCGAMFNNFKHVIKRNKNKKKKKDKKKDLEEKDEIK